MDDPVRIDGLILERMAAIDEGSHTADEAETLFPMLQERPVAPADLPSARKPAGSATAVEAGRPKVFGPCLAIRPTMVNVAVTRRSRPLLFGLSAKETVRVRRFPTRFDDR